MSSPDPDYPSCMELSCPTKSCGARITVNFERVEHGDAITCYRCSAILHMANGTALVAALRAARSALLALIEPFATSPGLYRVKLSRNLIVDAADLKELQTDFTTGAAASDGRFT